MLTKEDRIKGGKSASRKIKERNIEEYLKNPNYCKFCGKMIEPREGQKLYETKNKKYCNNSCGAKYQNKYINGYTLKEDRDPNWKRSRKCRIKEDMTIGSINGTNAHKYATLRAKARNKMDWNNIPKKCFICGYDIHVEVHHKKACSSFDDNTPVYIVNDLDNLVYLCPNHHYEADAGLLQL